MGALHLFCTTVALTWNAHSHSPDSPRDFQVSITSGPDWAVRLFQEGSRNPLTNPGRTRENPWQSPASRLWGQCPVPIPKVGPCKCPRWAVPSSSSNTCLTMELLGKRKMFTLTKALEKALLQHFIYMKVNIAYAINKPFPFFEALRDNSFITERMYKESLEACQNLVPLSKVVHNILTSLEQTFQPSVLLTLFSQVNLREYPSLVAIFRSFRNVGYTYEEKNRPPPTLLEDLANPAEGCSLQTLLPPPRPQLSLPSHLSSAPRVCDPRATAQPITEILDEQPSPSPQAVPLPGCIQEGKTTPVSSRDHQRKDKEDSREMLHSPSGPESVVKDDSPAANDLEMAQEVLCTPANKKARRKKRLNWSNSKRRRQKKKPRQDEMMGVASPGHGVQEKIKAVVSRRTLWKDDSSTNVKEVTKTLRARMRCAQTSNSQEISKEASKTSGRKRHGKRTSTAGKTTQVPEKTKNDAVDFLSPTFPVTCGKANGTLFQEKLKQGVSKKCIQNEAGDWLTVKEFLNEGRRATSKDWKKAIRCNGETLRQLEQKGLLFCTKSKPQKKGA
ncbi:interferon-induced protein 75 isoform X2 [Mus caroli]|uniref:Interferon-induced protein 75 isoform X2 n=1 Tax=Mus caroli TaxID=10089 RepID=A0A6P7QVJ3_MUSCR|nr:interferon-induced protein 75 isoform X2 [Mus caroli]